MGGTRDARFLTFSCIGRLALFGNDAIKDRFVEHLRRARERGDFRLFGWVVMPEHVHLLVLPGDDDDAKFKRTFAIVKTHFARVVVARWRVLRAPILERITGTDGRAWFWLPGGGYDRVMRSADDVREKLAYIHNNPMTRELVAKPTDWAWSSARWYAGMREGQLELDPLRL